MKATTFRISREPAGDGMPALSVRAPWWWAILHAGKDIENRDWSTRFRGRTLLHAGKWWKQEDVELDWMDVEDMASESVILDPVWYAMRAAGGCIVGSVEIVDCVTASSSPWFVGKYGFALRNPIAFERPIPCKGALGFFRPDMSVLRACV